MISKRILNTGMQCNKRMLSVSNHGGQRQNDQNSGTSLRTFYYISSLILGLSGTLFVFRKKNSSDLIECQATPHVDKLEPKKQSVDEKGIRNAIKKGRDLIRRIKDEVGAPGIVVGISIDGENVWEEGFGFADVENRVPCTRDTVMRIASISKSMTMAAFAKLWEEGKIDLDKPLQEYVPSFPQKTYGDEKVDITSRHLVSHLSGLRHYKSPPSEKSNDKSPLTEKENEKNPTSEKSNGNDKKKDEFDQKEYLLKDYFPTIQSALDLFKDDPLFHIPGSKYLYTTHGWTLISAVIESVAKELFTEHIAQMFKNLGLENTFLDVNDKLVYNRSRYYGKDDKGRLVNSPYVDNSYKWAGGGFLSTVGDLTKFGNIMLCSAQFDGSSKKGFLKQETVRMVWTPVPKAKCTEGWYGMGWVVVPGGAECEFCRKLRHYLYHDGGAIGASSVLLVLPSGCDRDDVLTCQWTDPPRGIVVAIITNMQSVNLRGTALEIAHLFDKLQSK